MDAQIGRFTSIDPHAENYLAWTPYNYVGGNPINLIDPDGMDWAISATYNEDGELSGINFTFKGAVRNSSNKKIDTKEEAKRMTEELQGVLKSINCSDCGKDFSITSDISIRALGSGENAKEDEHLIDFVDGLGAKFGESELGRKHIKLNASSKNLAHRKTFSHEALHTAGLTHVDEEVSNVNSIWHTLQGATGQYWGEALSLKSIDTNSKAYQEYIRQNPAAASSAGFILGHAYNIMQRGGLRGAAINNPEMGKHMKAGLATQIMKRQAVAALNLYNLNMLNRNE